MGTTVTELISHFNSVAQSYERSMALRPRRLTAVSYTFVGGNVRTSPSSTTVLPRLPLAPETGLDDGALETETESWESDESCSSDPPPICSDDESSSSDGEPAFVVPGLWQLCAARLRARIQNTEQVGSTQVEAREFVMHDADSAAADDNACSEMANCWGAEFQANWLAAPPTPQHFAIDESSGDELEQVVSDGEPNDPEEAVSNDIPYADLADLLELADAGERVAWPPAWSEASARAAMNGRQVDKAPTKRSRIALQPEAERNGGSTLFIPRPKAVPNVRVARVTGNGTQPLPAFGSGHDLRLSGEVVWCRKCGRYGEERIRADGLGGPCKGRRAANLTHLRDFRLGVHPATRLPLPPDVAYHR